MIRGFRHKRLRELFETGTSKAVQPSVHKRAIVRLDALDAAATVEELNQPGFDLHPLRMKPQRYTIHVNGPWCITFEWANGDALQVDLENYH